LFLCGSGDRALNGPTQGQEKKLQKKGNARKKGLGPPIVRRRGEKGAQRGRIGEGGNWWVRKERFGRKGAG